MITYLDYKNYFSHCNNCIEESQKIMAKLKLPPVSLNDWPENIESLTLYAFKSGYRGMAYDESRLITKVTDLERAYILLYALGGLKHIYQKNKLSEEIFYSTLTDLSLRLNLYFDSHNKLGLSKDDGHWLIRIYFLNIFKLGSLQFELLTLDFSVLPFQLTWLDVSYKNILQETKVISVHIMEGTDISEDTSLKSLNRAREFFAETKVNYFYCLSWLLNPNNKYLLEVPSNILSFADLFELKAWSSFSDWMIFSIFQGNIDSPAKTSLQSKAQQHRDKLGLGLGLIPFIVKGEVHGKN